MIRSIRNQILIPVVTIQVIAVAIVTLTAASLAARRMEGQIVDRLNGVVQALGHSNFPYTPSVLAKMRGLSGAHFAAYDEAGRVTEATLPSLRSLSPTQRSGRSMDRLDALGDSPTILLDGTRYFATSLKNAGGSRGSSLLVLYPETSWSQARREAATAPLVVGLGALALMVGVTSWIARRIGLRLRRVQQQVARIAAGDFEEFEPGRTVDEVEDLSRSVNRMCGQLREMRQTIRQSERTRLLAQLAAGLAHQLRNSITGARMSVQLHTRRCPPQEGDESLNVAIRQLAMTEEQVKGLLSLGRVEPRPPERCDAGQLLEDVALLVSPTCQHARVALHHHPADKPLPFLAESTSVRAAVLNLTLNAIEAAGAGGEVRLNAFNIGDEVALEVSDTGPGPPSELADQLYEPFVTGKQEGVGLGLALAHQVATAGGGRLDWSRGDGLTTFRLTLPMADSQARGVA
ncbi:ATP-binding protein [Tundrisphaera lichenicola]|uniref:sensor histidine kinase n=1 Tax=Tundrisphaera lichenicola TaxID=2029860 RepID=UPI003EBC9832